MTDVHSSDEHEHEHEHEHENNTGRSHGEHVVLDIGQDVGALVLYTRPELRGREIEVSRLDRDSPRVHTAILERSVNGQTFFAGVFPQLTAGVYQLCGAAPTQPKEVTIVAGTVVEVSWL